jgi:hypothetical protein
MLDPFRDQVGLGRFRAKLPKLGNLRPSPQTKDFLYMTGGKCARNETIALQRCNLKPINNGREGEGQNL